jgi:hypothetical protein
VAHDGARRHGDARLEIGSAQTAGGDPKEELTGSGNRVLDFGEFERSLFIDDGCAHDPILSLASGRGYL